MKAKCAATPRQIELALMPDASARIATGHPYTALAWGLWRQGFSLGIIAVRQPPSLGSVISQRREPTLFFQSAEDWMAARACDTGQSPSNLILTLDRSAHYSKLHRKMVWCTYDGCAGGVRQSSITSQVLAEIKSGRNQEPRSSPTPGQPNNLLIE